MGKGFRSFIIAILVMFCSISFVACGETPPAEFSIKFIVNDQIHDTITTTGNTVIKMPNDPTMDGYDFVGWYWDKYVWEKPFTVNSLLNTPLSSNMEVHARFVLKHTHSLERVEYKAATCGEYGNEEYWTCYACHRLFEDAYGVRELFSIPVLSKLAHTKGDWTVVIPATCEETGLRHRACEVCGAALEVEVVAITGHSYTEWRTTVEPTYTAKGEQVRGCEHCSLSETRDIPKLTVITSKPTNLTIEHGVLVWEGESTFGFEVIVNGETFTTTDNFFEPELIAEDYNTVKVAAIGLNDTRSEYEEITNFVVNSPISNLHFVDNGYSVTFSWDSPSNLYDYTFIINGVETTIAKDTHTCSVSSNTLSVGDNVEVYVQGVANANFYPSKKVGLTLSQIEAPVISIEGLNVVWSSVEHASSYEFKGVVNIVTDDTSRLCSYATENPGQYNVSVTACGTDYLSNTAQYSFTKLIEPSITVADRSLSWTPVAGQLKYAVIDGGEKTIITGNSYTITNPNSEYDVYLYAEAMQPNTMQSEIVVISAFSCAPYSSTYWGNLVDDVAHYEHIVGDVLYVPNSIMNKVDFSNIKNNVTLVASRVPYTLDKNVVTSIIIPSNITAIPMAAFENCVNATSAIISDSVTTINEDIFAGCTSLVSVTIPFVGDGEDNAFFGYFFGADSYELNSDTVPSSLKTVTITGGDTIADNAFFLCTNIETVVLPEGITTIGSDAFGPCTNLKSVNIPSSVTSIESMAFVCENLERVDITNLTAWCNIVFESGANPLNNGADLYINGVLLENLVVPKEITAINDYAFASSSIKTLSFESESLCTSIGMEAFANCSTLTSVSLPSSLVSIGDFAFGWCASLANVVVPDSVTSIEYAAFANCTTLANITLPFVGDGTTEHTNFGYIFAADSYESHDYMVPSSLKSVTITGGSVKSYAFSNCINIETILLPEGLTTIGVGAFTNCSSLHTINIPSSLTSISGSAFSSAEAISRVDITDLAAWCNITYAEENSNPLSKGGQLYLNDTLIENLVIPKEITTIKLLAFNKATQLKSVSFEEGSACTSIKYAAFAYCENLESVVLPSSITSIGMDAFIGCNNITNITLPFTGDGSSSNKHFGYLFGASKYTFNVGFVPDTLTSVTINGGATILDYAFYGCESIEIVHLPSSITTIGLSAFNGCTSLTEINIPSAVTSIANDAFLECSNIEKVYITDSAAWSAINFGNEYSNPLCYGAKLYVGDALVEHIVIAKEVTSIRANQYASNTQIKSVSFEEGSLCTSIGDGAFSGCTSLETVTLPEGLTSIGANAFYGCTKLTQISIPATVTYIGACVFANCNDLVRADITDIGAWCNVEIVDLNCLNLNTKLYLNGSLLENLVIPNNVTTINPYIFFGMTQFKTLSFESGSQCVSIGEHAFNGCSGLEEISIPSSVTSIGEYAFESSNYIDIINITDLAAWCNIDFAHDLSNPMSYTAQLYLNGSLIRNLVIPKEVTVVKDYTFFHCIQLSSITFETGSQCTTIGECAFMYSSATTVTIPNSVTSIEPSAFEGCSDLISITLPFTGDGTSNKTHFGYIFGAIDSATQHENVPFSLKEVHITKTTSLADYVFECCADIETITLPEGLTSIGYGSFFHCYALSNINFPSTLTSIGESAFETCSGLSSIEFPSALISIGEYAFIGCSGLTNIVIPNSVTSIGFSAFKNCNTLASITLPFVGDGSNNNNFGYIFGTSAASQHSETVPASIKSVTITGGEYIASSAFANCVNIESIVLSNGITEIGGGAFANCAKLQSVTIPNTVLEIGAQAFYYCSGLKSIIIPNSVEFVYQETFVGCTSLESITLPSISGNLGLLFGAYEYETQNRLIPASLKTVTITGNTTIADYAFYGCVNIETIILGEGGNGIGAHAFEDCDNLTTIAIPSTLTSIGAYAFNDCISIERVDIVDIAAWCGISFANNDANPLFYGAKLYLNGVLVENLVIPKEVTIIKTLAFDGAAQLKTVSFESGSACTTIETTAFSNCSKITSITLPNSLTTIKEGAFINCSLLTSLVIPDSVTSIGFRILKGCNALASITLPFVGDGTSSNTHFGYIFGAPDSEENPNYVPASLKTVTITGGTSIADCAFYECVYIETIVLPAGLTTIGNYAFEWCGGLKTINIPSTVTTIGECAFDWCCELTDIALPAGLTTIGEYAFCNCSGLTNIVVPNSVTSIGYGAFSGCSALTSMSLPSVGIMADIFGAPDSHETADYVPSTLKTVTITGGTSIADCAFYNCENIETIVLPEGITTIGVRAFEGCVALTSINIPSTVTSINDGAFYGCSGLTSITLPNGLLCIGEGAFGGCRALTSMVVPNSVTSIGGYAFTGCEVLQSITLPFVGDGSNINTNFGYIFGAQSYLDNEPCVPASLKTVTITGGTIVGGGAFYGCSSIQTINLPDSITTIEYSAFDHCSSLTTINIPYNVDYIEYDAFAGCSKLTTVNITDIAAWCAISFDNDNSQPFISTPANLYVNGVMVEDLVIPKEVVNIKYYAFAGLSQLKTVSFETGSACKTIGEGAFGSCGNLTSVSIPSGVTSIQLFAFNYCTKLTNINIPNTVTHIGDEAFYNCESLTSMVIPNSVTNIGYSAFGSCDALTGISLPYSTSGDQYFGYIFGAGSYLTQNDSIPAVLTSVTITGGTSITECAFFGCYNIETIVLPNTITTIDTHAFYGCSSLTSIVLPEGLTAIGSSAFEECGSLETINIPSTVTSIGEFGFKGNNLSCVNITDMSAWCNIDFKNEKSNPIYNGAKLYLNGVLVEDLVIPNSVTAISNHAFNHASQLKSLSFENGSACTSIGTEAFLTCSNLETISLPTSLTQIGLYAFAYCGKVTNVIVPDSVTLIGSHAFASCNTLESITLPFVGSGSTGFDYFGYVFGKLDSNDTTGMVPSSIKSVTITGGTAIADDAFYGCNYIERVILPEGITTIGISAFEGCSALARINIPSTVNSIGVDAFLNYSERLTRIDIVDIASWCNIDFANETATPVVPLIGKVYLNNTILTDLVIPKNVTTIKSLAFFGFGMESLSFEEGSSCTTIELLAFASCPSLTSVSLTNTLVEIQMGAFASCPSLTEIEIPNSVTSIGMGALLMCTSLESISLPLVGDGSEYSEALVFKFAFFGDSGIDADIPTSLKTVVVTGGSIIDNAFFGFADIETIVIQEGITSIGAQAFVGCSSLTSVAIPSSITNIGEKAFSSCSNLVRVDITDFDAWCNISFYNTEANPLYNGAKLYLNGELVEDVVISNDITSISASTLGGLTQVKNITFEAGSQCTSVEENAFAGYTNIESISLPEGVTEIGANAFKDCSSLTEITIPSTVTSISASAFEGCLALETVNVGDVSSWASISFTTLESNPIYNGAKLYQDGVLVEDITISNDVSQVGDYAFYGATQLKSVNIASSPSATAIGASSGVMVKAIAISSNPQGVTSIGTNAFYGCTNLTNVVIPNSVTSIGANAFTGCNNIVSITLPFVGDGSSKTHFSYLFGDVNYGNPAVPSTLKTVTVTGTEILENAFENCTSIKTIVLAESVQHIDALAFAGSGVEMITISGILTYVDRQAFAELENIVGVNITSIANWCASSFERNYANPIYNGIPLYLNGELIENMVIPKEVTIINIFTFAGMTQLKSLTFETGSLCNTIDQYAFSGCSSLSQVTIPNSVTRLAWGCFDSCTSLTSIVVPNSVTSIVKAFSGCSSLASITLPFVGDGGSTNTHFGYIFGGASYSDNSTVVPGTLKNVTITGGDTIGANAFSNCNNIERVVLPEGITSIKSNAFGLCNGLKYINIPSTVTSIESYAFMVIGWGSSEFVVDIASLESWSNITFGSSDSNPLSVCSKLYIGGIETTEIVIPKEVTAIKDNAFCQAAVIRGLSFEEGSLCTSIGENAFLSTNINNVTLPVGLEIIGYSAFAYCNNLSNINIPDTVQGIDSSAFEYCNKLTNIVIPNSVTSIGLGAFSGCDSLESITLPFVGGSINSDSNFGYIFGIDDYIEHETSLPSSLKEVHITNATTIAECAFYGCVNITTISLPACLTTIENSAFTYCPKISRVNITDLDAWNSITFEDSYANPLYNGAKLYLNGEEVVDKVEDPSVLVISSDVDSIGSSQYANNLDITTVIFEAGSQCINIDNQAFKGCTNLTSIVIPDSVMFIGLGAFEGCTALESITIPFIGSCSADSGMLTTETYFGYIFGANGYTDNATYVPTSLKEVYVTNAITIADYAFYGCNTLEYIELNNGITSIGDSAFESCGVNGNIRAMIIIPSSVDYMGTDVFVDCSADVYYEFASAPDTWVNDWLGPTGVHEYWYSETQPTSYRDKYWHYVDGVPTIW